MQGWCLNEQKFHSFHPIVLKKFLLVAFTILKIRVSNIYRLILWPVDHHTKCTLWEYVHIFAHVLIFSNLSWNQIWDPWDSISSLNSWFFLTQCQIYPSTCLLLHKLLKPHVSIITDNFSSILTFGNHWFLLSHYLLNCSSSMLPKSVHTYAMCSLLLSLSTANSLPFSLSPGWPHSNLSKELT